MQEVELSEKQLAALAPNIRLIEACPGAGKTRTVVERFKQQVLLSDRGVGLLSFTNSAIDEATKRCGQDSKYMRVPNFIGTFDSFIHRYIVTPFYASRLGRAPTYLMSWSDLKPEINSKHFGTRGGRVSMSNFSIDSGGNVCFLEGSLGGIERQAFNALSTEEQTRKIDERKAVIGTFTQNGTFDSDTARWKALEILRSEHGVRILDRLSKRFSSVLVDEFQDCAAIEHEILGLMHSSGIHVSVVADPDQAIYGFRFAEPRLYDEYRSNIADDDIATLDINYRSSNAICDLVQTLRDQGRKPMSANPDNQQGLSSEIYLIGGSPERVREKFLMLAEEWSIGSGERIALAHRKSVARKLAAGGGTVPKGESKMKILLENLAVLRSSGSAAIRRRSLSELEKLIVHQFNWNADQQRLDSAEKLEVLGKDRTWSRLIVGEMLQASLTWKTSDDAGVGVRGILSRYLSGLEISVLSGLPGRFQKPSTLLWTYWNDAGIGRDQTVQMGWSTIHASKGREYDAVLLETPPARVVNSIIAGEYSEDRRVFYVGASRARKLLVLQVSMGRFNTVKAQFESLGLSVNSQPVR